MQRLAVRPLASSVSDNFFYWLEHDGDVLLIDPIDTALAVHEVRTHQPRRVRIVTTHGHGDHQGGNAAVVSALGCRVLAPVEAGPLAIEADEVLADGDTLRLGGMELAVRHVPGHTPGHIGLLADGQWIGGDVLFLGGVGTCRFGGDPVVLFETIHHRLADLPDETSVWPGHDYAARNLLFAQSVGLADGTDVAFMLERAATHQRAFGPLETTLGRERRHNPFLRVHDKNVQQTVRQHAPEIWDALDDEPALRAFRTLRALRDSF